MNDIFDNKNTLKIISLILGVMLWLVVSMDDSKNTQNILPLQTEYTYEENVVPLFDENKYVITMTPQKVNVTLSGEQGVINKIKNGLYDGDIRFSANLEKASVGSYQVGIEYSGFPSGVKVEFEPGIVHVNLETKE